MKSWLAYGKFSVTARRSTITEYIQAVKVSATSNASGESYNNSHPIRQRRLQMYIHILGIAGRRTMNSRTTADPS